MEIALRLQGYVKKLIDKSRNIIQTGPADRRRVFGGQNNLLIPLILCIGCGRALLALRATPPLFW
tara:strand:- start:2291 stop:2485 length:195 start_codon:yes stop_codon:yes gene_type:complete